MIRNGHFRSQRVKLQNSPYFCVFKYAQAVKQKVWNEAENIYLLFLFVSDLTEEEVLQMAVQLSLQEM